MCLQEFYYLQLTFTVSEEATLLFLFFPLVKNYEKLINVSGVPNKERGG